MSDGKHIFYIYKTFRNLNFMVYKFKNTVGRNDFSDKFRKTIIHCEKMDTAWVLNPITV